MACTYTGPFEGGTWNNAIITSPTITGGEVVNVELSNISIEGAVTLDDNAKSSLADALSDDIMEVVCSAFTNCAGAPLEAGNSLATCEEMTAAIEAAVAPTITSETPPSSGPSSTGNILPATIIGVDRSQLLGKPVTYIKFGDYIVPAYLPE